MSATYIRHLRRIGRELLAAKGALNYAGRSWDRHDLANDSDLREVGPQDIRNAADNLEATFIIRLFATFEGILKEHLAQQHPGIAVPEDARAVWLIDRAAVLQSPPIGAPLRQRVHDVRKYRNVLVHASSVLLPRMTFFEVLLRLITYLSKLPEPYS